MAREVTAALVFLFAASVSSAFEDNRRHMRPSSEFRPDMAYRRSHIEREDFTPHRPPTMTEHSVNYFREAFVGGIKGDYIKSPTVANVVGNILVGLSPAGVFGDARDFTANFYKAAKVNFKEHKKDAAFSLAAMIPAVSELKHSHSLYKAHRSISVSIKAGYVVSKLPPLTGTYAKAFDGPIETITLKKGDIVYRSPQIPRELAHEPRRWYGLVDVRTRRQNDALYNHVKWDNPNLLTRRYVVLQDFSVHSGKVAGGNGFQVRVPNNVDPKDVLEYVGTRRLHGR